MNKGKRTVRVSHVKMFLMLGVFLWLAPGLHGAVPVGRTLMVTTNGALLAPTNFFNTNAAAVYRGLTNAGYTFGSGVGVRGTNGIVSVTNGNEVSLSLYSAPAIASFVNDQNSVEIGATVTSTILDWTLSGGAITSQSLNQGIGALAIGLRTYTHTNSYTTDRTYTLTASDGTTTPVANTSVTFLSKAYWGVSALTTLSDGQIIALNGSGSPEFATSRLRTKSITANNEYIYIAYPASFGTASFVVGGFTDTAWTLEGGAAQNFVNASGATVSYNVYRSNDTALGTFTVEVE